MARKAANDSVDLSESSIYGDAHHVLDEDDVATDDRIDRLEAITGGAEEPPAFEGELAQQDDELDASTEEELDALEINLTQDDDPYDALESSGRVVDDVAEEQIAAFTEVGPLADNRGGVSVAPGREDTSRKLRSHHPAAEDDGSDAIVEGNIDEPLDEDDTDRLVDEGTAA